MIDDSNPEDLNNLKKLERIDIEKEMQSSFLDYAMKCYCIGRLCQMFVMDLNQFIEELFMQ